MNVSTGVTILLHSVLNYESYRFNFSTFHEHSWLLFTDIFGGMFGHLSLILPVNSGEDLKTN
jgi:hypothetical protein